MVESKKDLFLSICRDTIHRDGLEDLLSWMENETDFFIAPASTRFHSNYEGGLVEHSLNVYNSLIRLQDTFESEVKASRETLAIIALFHDLCKANYYTVSMRNVKDEATGRWTKVPYYTTDDKFPYGHGEKSVYLISKFMRLSDEEAMAIRWHMGGFDSATKGGDYGMGKAYEMYPIATLLHLADMAATYFMESDNQ